MSRQGSSSGLLQTAGRPAITTHDKLWAEMQLKLEDIELSASASGAGVVPALGHGNTALEDLRVAQVALAQAWRRNKDDNHTAEDGGGPPNAAGTKDAKSSSDEHGKASDTTQAAHAAAKPDNKATGTTGGGADGPANTTLLLRSDGTQASEGQAGGGSGGDVKPFYLEDKTRADIQSARKRREANDEHFGKVSKGVLDVVQKLDTVAKSMIVVEEATKEIWATNNGDSTSEDSVSINTTR